jgi:predicted HD phosphohydrolase
VSYRSVALAAALLHDIGKIREFAYGRTITPSPQGKLVGGQQQLSLLPTQPAATA